MTMILEDNDAKQTRSFLSLIHRQGPWLAPIYLFGIPEFV